MPALSSRSVASLAHAPSSATVVSYAFCLHRPRLLVNIAVLLALAIAGCSPSASGPGQVPNASSRQDDTRDTSGMH